MNMMRNYNPKDYRRNNNMKAFGLHNLVLCYIQWKDKDREQNAQNELTEPEEQTEQ